MSGFCFIFFSSDFLPGSMGPLSFLLLPGDPSEDVLMTHGKPQLSSFVLGYFYISLSLYIHIYISYVFSPQNLGCFIMLMAKGSNVHNVPNQFHI